jgi:hypothetical protein
LDTSKSCGKPVSPLQSSGAADFFVDGYLAMPHFISRGACRRRDIEALDFAVCKTSLPENFSGDKRTKTLRQNHDDRRVQIPGIRQADPVRISRK